MTKVKVATRVLNEAYLIEAFLGYYVQAGVDEIHVFDSGSEDGTIDVVQSWAQETGSVRITFVDSQLKHTSEAQERKLCNLVLRHAVQDYQREGEPCWWLFPDVDEFVRAPCGELRGFLGSSETEAVRSIFIDWHLPPSRARSDLPAVEVLRLAHSGALLGRFGDLWGDPFCKDYAILLDPRTHPLFRRMQAVSGFHRLALDSRLFIPPNDRYVVVDHLRGIPIRQALSRVEQRLRLLQHASDDWSLAHYLLVWRELHNYESFYAKAGLRTAFELATGIPTLVEFDNARSFFNGVIMRETLTDPQGSRPSAHGITVTHPNRRENASVIREVGSIEDP